MLIPSLTHLDIGRRTKLKDNMWSTLVATICSSLMAGPALAQVGEGGLISVPAEKQAISPGGVDLRTGRYTYDQTDLSIGDEAGGLSLTRTFSTAVPKLATPALRQLYERLGHRIPDFPRQFKSARRERRIPSRQRLSCAHQLRRCDNDLLRTLLQRLRSGIPRRGCLFEFHGNAGDGRRRLHFHACRRH